MDNPGHQRSVLVNLRITPPVHLSLFSKLREVEAEISSEGWRRERYTQMVRRGTEML